MAKAKKDMMEIVAPVTIVTGEGEFAPGQTVTLDREEAEEILRRHGAYKVGKSDGDIGALKGEIAGLKRELAARDAEIEALEKERDELGEALAAQAEGKSDKVK